MQYTALIKDKDDYFHKIHIWTICLFRSLQKGEIQFYQLPDEAQQKLIGVGLVTPMGELTPFGVRYDGP